MVSFASACAAARVLFTCTCCACNACISRMEKNQRTEGHTAPSAPINSSSTSTLETFSLFISRDTSDAALPAQPKERLPDGLGSESGSIAKASSKSYLLLHANSFQRMGDRGGCAGARGTDSDCAQGRHSRGQRRLPGRASAILAVPNVV